MRYLTISRAIFLVVLLVLLVSLSVGCGSDEGDGEPVNSPVVTDTEQGIAIISSDVSADFPQSLTFEMKARSDSEITSVELRYKIVKMVERVVTTTIKPEFDAGTAVDVAWLWDTRKTSLPPGAEIDYRWVLKDAAGQRLESEESTFIFQDNRYDWRELSERNVSIFWYEGDADFARELMDAAQSALTKLERDTGGVLEKPVKLFIYANSTELRQALVFPQEWTGGIAFTEYGIVAIGISENNLEWGMRTVAHELTHLVIEQVTASPYNAFLPTWLNEGLAMYVEGDLRADLASKLNDAMDSDSLFSVASLGSSFPADAGQAGQAYAQSYSLVEFLIDDYGSQKMLQFLEMFKEGSTTDDALLAVYGFDSAQLDDLWRASLGLQGPVAIGS